MESTAQIFAIHFCIPRKATLILDSSQLMTKHSGGSLDPWSCSTTDERSGFGKSPFPVLWYSTQILSAGLVPPLPTVGRVATSGSKLSPPLENSPGLAGHCLTHLSLCKWHPMGCATHPVTWSHRIWPPCFVGLVQLWSTEESGWGWFSRCHIQELEAKGGKSGEIDLEPEREMSERKREVLVVGDVEYYCFAKEISAGPRGDSSKLLLAFLPDCYSPEEGVQELTVGTQFLPPRAPSAMFE
ncbi:hypothetical protein Cadr_000020211 [Camelus dromedarius]|uniref:Uncharacterized protein n=1 Tax=Camelus dromedarius TaxID=9838 RepID=A0A5N4CYV2_CAMDR|nr:hypothetical protein Cadr_000020211 [Camelus dromedarius]